MFIINNVPSPLVIDSKSSDNSYLFYIILFSLISKYVNAVKELFLPNRWNSRCCNK